MLKKITKELEKLIEKSITYDEVPVSAIIVKNNKIISKAYNKRNKTNNVLNHAEVIAIIKAAKKLKNWRLNDCELIISLEPCDMCKKIIEESRIKKVYYILKRTKTNNINVSYEQIKVENSAFYEEKLKTFFKQKR